MTCYTLPAILITALLVTCGCSAQLNTALVKPPTNATNPNLDLAQFEAFVPENVEVLLVSRPQQLHQYKPLQPSIADYSSFLGSAEIELIAVASSQQTIQHIRNAPMDSIRKSLSARLGEAPPVNFRTMAQHMSQDFSALVKFAQPTEIGVIEVWLQRFVQKDRVPFRRTKREQQEILDGGADRCSVVQLDPQTFVIGNRQRLKDTLESADGPNTRANVWLRDLVDSDFQGELFFRGDITKVKKSNGIGMMGFATSSLNNVKELQIQIGFKQSTLASVEAEFDQRESADHFLSFVESGIEQMEDAQKQMMIRRTPGIAKENDLWRARKTSMLAESLSIQQAGQRVTLKLPRPTDLDQLIVDMFKKHKESSKEFERIQEQNRANMQELLIWRSDMRPGQIVQAADIGTENWPAQLVPKDSAQDVQSLVGHKSRGRHMKGLPITTNDVKP